MFTGLIEELGKIARITNGDGTRRIVVSCSRVVRELKTGDSIAVNGVCLTALDITPQSFSADLAAETVQRTSLTRLSPGAIVNLELPTKAGSRLGGHVVQGHVDGVGKLISINRDSGREDWRMAVELPDELEKYVVPKGSIAVEGISLTVAQTEDNVVHIAIIPHTFESTNLKSLQPGDLVNIEADVLAKYAEKMLRGEAKSSGITVERLISEGF